MKLLPFSEKNLAFALKNNYTPEDIIRTKNHFQYFLKYLGTDRDGLKAKSILIEENYVSKDFLQDYASYYSLCFEQYPKFCKRIHFFNKPISRKVFKDLIINPNSEHNEFWNNYLGFIVVKPIPVTIIGYSVLKTYTSSKSPNSRNFWGVREYKVHLFGKELKINSLAFQEQDSVLSACSTTAIWSMLNKAALDFYTTLKSPSQITRDADNISPDGSRLFPNKGLNIIQISQAIYNSGLVSEIKQPDTSITNGNPENDKAVLSNRYLKKIINAYSPIGIPIILIIYVPNGGEHGLHAITVSGSKHKKADFIAPKKEISWYSDNIEKIYAHDDQWGPFVKIDLVNEFELITPWTDCHKTNEPTLVKQIVVPLFPKIRISYIDIEVIVLGLDTLFTLFFQDKLIADLVWDVKLVYSDDFKNDLQKSNLELNSKFKRLTTGLPKYIWVASCHINSHKVFDFTFDATNVSNAMFGLDAICYFPDITELIVNFLEGNRNILDSLFQHRESVNYFEFLIKCLKS